MMRHPLAQFGTRLNTVLLPFQQVQEELLNLLHNPFRTPWHLVYPQTAQFGSPTLVLHHNFLLHLSTNTRKKRKPISIFGLAVAKEYFFIDFTTVSMTGLEFSAKPK